MGLWLRCGIAIAVIALIAVVGGSGTTVRSLDDVDERRARRPGLRAGGRQAAPAA